MIKYDDFDLNLKQNVFSINKELRITSQILCTIGNLC